MKRRLPAAVIEQLRQFWLNGMTPYRASLIELRPDHWKPTVSETAIRSYFKEFDEVVE